jgi:hypothetical protein
LTLHLHFRFSIGWDKVSLRHITVQVLPSPYSTLSAPSQVLTPNKYHHAKVHLGTCLCKMPLRWHSFQGHCSGLYTANASGLLSILVLPGVIIGLADPFHAHFLSIFLKNRSQSIPLKYEVTHVSLLLKTFQCCASLV